jgi:hypothetical protein
MILCRRSQLLDLWESRHATILFYQIVPFYKISLLLMFFSDGFYLNGRLLNELHIFGSALVSMRIRRQALSSPRSKILRIIFPFCQISIFLIFIPCNL